MGVNWKGDAKNRVVVVKVTGICLITKYITIERMIIIVFLYLIHLLSEVVVLGKMASLKSLVSHQERTNSQPLDIKILGHKSL